jgi:hypothetical protein
MESLGLVSAATERSAMVNVETESRLAGHAILGKAFRYFGPQGLNLGVSEESGRSDARIHQRPLDRPGLKAELHR